MVYVKKPKVRKAKAPYKRRARKYAAKPTKNFTKMVKSIIHKQAETKQVSYTLGMTQFNSGVNSSGDVLRIIPSLQQGVTEASRIGDTVTAQRIDTRGHFLINVVPATTNNGGFPTVFPSNCRLMIRAFICSVKKFSNYDDAVANVSSWSPNFLKNGTSSQALDGTIESMYLPVNTDVITVHKEIKKYITAGVVTSGFSGTPPATWAVGSGYDPRGSVKFFNHTQKCKKVLKYDDSNYSPQNYAPFMVISYAHLDGTSPDVLTTVISATFVTTLFYEDV